MMTTIVPPFPGHVRSFPTKEGQGFSTLLGTQCRAVLLPLSRRGRRLYGDVFKVVG